MFKKTFRHLVWGMTDSLIGVLQDHTRGKLARRGRKARTSTLAATPTCRPPCPEYGAMQSISKYARRTHDAQ